MSQTEVLTIRSHTGISGDMTLAGLAALYFQLNKIAPDGAEADCWLAGLCAKILPELEGCLKIRPASISGVRGWRAEVDLPRAHAHRGLAEIAAIIESSGLSDPARTKALAAFTILADCEAACHGISPDEVHFHEVGALDSILDVCAACEIFVLLGSPRTICGPLPLADGSIACAHGFLPAPAPAALRLLRGMSVKPFAGSGDAGELLTPTGLTLLRVFDASFGPWPEAAIKETALVYGRREFAGVPNGVIFACGRDLSENESQAGYCH